MVAAALGAKLLPFIPMKKRGLALMVTAVLLGVGLVVLVT